MPRVNRDLQRRIAARRERERRRPTTERRYRFTTPEPGLEAEELVVDQESSVEDGAVAEPAQQAARLPSRGAARATATRPFTAYRDDYAYVYADLRRVAAVIGGLLVALIVLYFVLPLLAH